MSISTSSGQANDVNNLIQQSEPPVSTDQSTNINISTEQGVDIGDLILQLGRITLELNEIERAKRDLEASRITLLARLADHPQYITICSDCGRSSLDDSCIICQQIR